MPTYSVRTAASLWSHAEYSTGLKKGVSETTTQILTECTLDFSALTGTPLIGMELTEGTSNETGRIAWIRYATLTTGQIGLVEISDVWTGGETVTGTSVSMTGGDVLNPIERTAGTPEFKRLMSITAENQSWAVGLGTESLEEVNFATHADWDVTGDFDDSGGNAAYTHSTGVGTLTQIAADQATAGVGDKQYRFTYTVSGVSGDPAAEITTAYALIAEALTLTAGTHNLDFFSNAAPGDFVISATSTSGGFTLDDVTLKQKTTSLVHFVDVRFTEKIIFTNLSTDAYMLVSNRIVDNVLTPWLPPGRTTEIKLNSSVFRLLVTLSAAGKTYALGFIGDDKGMYPNYPDLVPRALGSRAAPQPRKVIETKVEVTPLSISPQMIPVPKERPKPESKKTEKPPVKEQSEVPRPKFETSKEVSIDAKMKVTPATPTRRVGPKRAPTRKKGSK